MRIVSTTIEALEFGRFRMISILEVDPPNVTRSGNSSQHPIGSGPIESGAIPDRIVHALIQAGPPYSMNLSDIQSVLGGNPRTVNRQAWTLASNAPDLQIRLRGWVFSPVRGKYALSEAAIRHVEDDRLIE
jgi:hypothetical protein